MIDKTPARTQWDAMPEMERANLLIGSVFSATKKWRAHGWKMAGMICNQDDACMVAAAAFPDFLEDMDKSPELLPVVAYRAITRAAQRLQRDNAKWDTRTAAAEIQDAEGGAVIIWDAVPCYSPTMSRTGNTAGIVIVRDAINRAAHNDADKKILDLLESGFTVRQIADIVGTSKSSVQRRIDKIRDRIGNPAELYAMLG